VGLVVGFGSKNLTKYAPITLLVVAAPVMMVPPGRSGWAALVLAGGRLAGVTPAPVVAGQFRREEGGRVPQRGLKWEYTMPDAYFFSANGLCPVGLMAHT